MFSNKLCIFQVRLSIIAFVFLVHYRNSQAKFLALEQHIANLELTDSKIIISSNLGYSEVPWSAVTEIWGSERLWLLLFSKAQFITLPFASLSDDLQKFLLDRAATNGVKIT